MTVLLHVLGIVAAVLILWVTGAFGMLALWIVVCEIGGKGGRDDDGLGDE